MGKPTGFIEYLRELPVDRSPVERVRDWNEFHHHMDEKRLRQQGGRSTVRTVKEIAVIGAGPAGVAAHGQLNKAGHSVTVLERADRPGGLLPSGIPNMNLDKRDVVARRMAPMEKEGIKFVCNGTV